MPFDNVGRLDGARPDMPAGAPYQPPPVVPVAGLDHKKMFGDPPAPVHLPLALHHVVPWETLWGFWNAMLDAQAYEAVQDYAALFGVSRAASAGWEALIRRQRFRTATLPPDFEQRLCWHPWNLVRGPRDRVLRDHARAGREHVPAGTDPGSALDDMSFAAGQEATHIAFMVESVGRFMQATTADTTQTRLRMAVGSWALAARHGLVEFRREMWLVDRLGPGYRASVGGGHPVYPQWLVKTKAATGG